MSYGIDFDIIFEQRGSNKKQYLVVSVENVTLSYPYEKIPLTKKADILINVNQIKNNVISESQKYLFFIKGVSDYINSKKLKIEFDFILTIWANTPIRTKQLLKYEIQEGLLSVLYDVITNEIYECNISYKTFNLL